MPDQTVLTADVVLFGRREDNQLCVLLIRRGDDPFAGRWALPGGCVDPGEDTAAAARRELLEETGLEVGPLTLVGVYNDPGRDPRGPYETTAYLAMCDGTPAPTAGDDAADAQWCLVSALTLTIADVAFDHRRIILDAVRLRGGVR